MSPPPEPRRLGLLRLVLAAWLLLVLVQTVLVFHFAAQRADAGLGARFVVPDQMAGMILLLDGLPAADRPLALRALNGAGVEVRLGLPREALPACCDPWDLTGLVASYLPADRPALRAAVRIRVRSDLWLLPPYRVHLQARLGDGTSVSAVVSDSVVNRVSLMWSLGGLALVSVLLALGVVRGVLALMRPLARVAAAADRFAADPEAPPLPVTGPAELRRVSSAFNAMQAGMRQLIEQRTRMLLTVAHDLRSGLARLQLRLGRLDLGATRAPVERDLAFLMRVIDHNLGFASVVTAAGPVTLTDIAALVQDGVDDRAETGAAVSYSGPARLDARARPDALRRALANLIDNALAYAGSAEVALERSGGEIVLSVADRGPGIPEAERALVLRPWQRGGAGLAAGGDGAGLGLSIAQAVAVAEGGRLEIADRPGGGCLIRLVWPTG